MFTLIWYHAALPDCIKECIIKKPKNEDKEVKIISFKLNEVTFNLRKYKTWFNFLTKMPDSVKQKEPTEDGRSRSVCLLYGQLSQAGMVDILMYVLKK